MILAEKTILRLRGENACCGFRGKIRFAVFVGKFNFGFSWEVRFMVSTGKCGLAVLAEIVLLRLWRETTFWPKIVFSGFGRKCFLAKKCYRGFGENRF